MTSEQLNELEKLAEAATPGPWASPQGWHLMANKKHVASVEQPEDMRFIIGMREQALPLIWALREAQAEIERLRRHLGEIP